MKRKDWLIAGALMLASLPLLFSGIDLVPFHPDETSFLFQSRDVELLFEDPQPIIHPELEPDVRAASYRYLNAPLPKLILAAGRLVAGFDHTSVAVDWSWPDTWDSNLAAGAMPPMNALLGARRASTLLLLLTIPALYVVGLRIGDRRSAIACAVLFVSSGLVLLHGRRAMAEGTMLFATSVALALAIAPTPPRPWLAGAAAGLAVAAKHSMLPVLAGTALWLFLAPGQTRARGAVRAAVACVFAFAVLWLLTPAMWFNPIGGALATVDARQALLAAQAAETQSLAPGGALTSPLQRLASLFGHAYLLPLQFQEVGNYRTALAPSIDGYTQLWWVNGWRGPLAGGVLLGATLFGGVSAFYRPSAKHAQTLDKRVGLLFITLAELAAIVLANPLPVQRYYLPLLPMLVLWAGLGVSTALDAGKMIRSGLRSKAGATREPRPRS